MSSPTPTSESPSMIRTGAKAGLAFARSVAFGFLTALVLGGGVFFVYLGRLSGPGMPGAGHTGGAGAVLALLFSPPLLVSLLLLAFIPIYLMLGVARGRSRAIQQLVLAHGDSITQRLAGVIAGRIETMPRTKGALERVSDVVSADAIVQQVSPVLGNGRAVRAVTGFVVQRLPLAELMQQWQQRRAESPSEASAPGTPDPVLRSLLSERIGDTLREASTPSRTPFYIALGVQAVLLGVGWWLTS